MRSNCENCVGETRIACDAVFTDVREMGGTVLRKGLELGENDIIGLLALQDNAVQKNVETRQKLAELGCTLSEGALVSSLLSETSAGLILTAADMDEEAEQADREYNAHIDAILEKSRISQERWDAGAAEREENRRRTEELLERSRTTDAEVRELLERISNRKADQEAERKAARDLFYVQRGLDPDNVSLADKLELRGHLRKLGLED